MTPEERIIGLEQMVADLAEMVSSLTWGRHGTHPRNHHNLGFAVLNRAEQQRDAVHAYTPKINVETILTGRKFR